MLARFRPVYFLVIRVDPITTQILNVRSHSFISCHFWVMSLCHARNSALVEAMLSLSRETASKPRQFHVVDQRPLSEGPFDDTIDPRLPDEEGTTRPIEDLVNLPVSDKEPSKVLKIRKNLPDGIQEAMSEF